MIDLYLLVNFFIVLPLAIIHINFFRYPTPNLDVFPRVVESLQMLVVAWLSILGVKWLVLILIKWLDKLNV